MRWLHFHRDPNWQLDGCWRYFQCRCGARRVCRHYANLLGPTRPGWGRLLRDSHGVPVDDSGWRKPPLGGWPAEPLTRKLPPLPHGPAPGATA